ncbi:MAG: hypothetical protein ACOY0T_20055 [Myxococcota bacterium]
MKRILLGLVASATTLPLANLAIAGTALNQPVTFSTNNGLQVVSGGLRAARFSSDNRQFISCSIYAYDTDEEGHDTLCMGVDANGAVRACSASGAMTEVAADMTATLNLASHITFTINPDGTCARITVAHRSLNL